MTDTVNVSEEMIDAVMKVAVGVDECGSEVFPGPLVAAELVRAALAAAPKAEPAISLDGPHKPSSNRKWLARQLLDSKLTEDEAYGIVAHHPAIHDRAQSEAPKVEQEPVICHHEAYQGSCAHCGVKIVNGFAVRPKAHPAPSRELLAVAEAALEWIDAIPESVVTDHIPMPGLDRDWADDVIDKHKGPQS